MDAQFSTTKSQEANLSRPRLSSQGSSSSTPYSVLNKSFNGTSKQAKSAKVFEIIGNVQRNQYQEANHAVVPSLEGKSASNWKNYMNEQSLLSAYSSIPRGNPVLNYSSEARKLSFTPKSQQNCSFNAESHSKSRQTQAYNINNIAKSNISTQSKTSLGGKTDSAEDESGLQATSYVLAKEIERQTVQLGEHDKLSKNLRTSNQQLQGINNSLISRVHTSEAGIRDLSQKVDFYERNILALDSQIIKIEENSSQALNELNNQILQARHEKQKFVEESVQKMTLTFLTKQKEHESAIQELENRIRKSDTIHLEQETKNQQLQAALREFQEKYDRLEVVCREGAHLEKENRLLHEELNKLTDQKNIDQENNELRQQLSDTSKEVDALKDIENTLQITQKELKKTEQYNEGLKSALVELDAKNKRQNSLLMMDSQHISELETDIAQIKQDNDVFKVSLDANHKECEELFNDFKVLKKHKMSLQKGNTSVFKGTNQSIGLQRDNSIMSRSQYLVSSSSSGLFF